MFPEYSSATRVRGQRSSALVITLAALVLISALLLVFLNQSALNRQISFSSAGQYRADLLAHTALDTITGDLRTEIAAGSTAYTSNNISIYIPITNFTVVPCQVANQGFANLVKQSTSTSNFWTGIYYNSSIFNPIRSAANNSTTNTAASGRDIQINQWNEPGLLGDPGSGTIAAVPNTYTTPPDWVMVTRQGPVTHAAGLPTVGPGTGTLSDKSSGNGNYVIGRYAYTIYNEGGLLDVNIAGYPSNVSGTDFTTKRGLLPQVDLANIPGINNDANADALVQWRNQNTAASATSYTNYFLTATNGFMTVAAGDQAFVSRRDLINYMRANTNTIATSSLQYLSTFTRELNAPSYTPNSNRPRVQSGNFATGLDDQYNPSLINLRVTQSFTRNVSDGTTSQIGEPLIKYRFPLSRLNWVGYAGPNGASATQIYNSFGLKWSPTSATTGFWVYNHGDPNRILKLSEVAVGTVDTADGPREPDFFELLQAGILVGSLGKTGCIDYSDVSSYDSVVYFQIIQIGANIIDQYDSDSYPTRISFGGIEIDGIENLPYLVRVFSTPYRFHGLGQPSNFPNLGLWYQPEIWNPFALPRSASSNGPSQFRFITTGTAFGNFYGSGNRRTAINYFTDPSPNTLSDPYGIQFSTAGTNSFGQPTLLSPLNSTTTGNNMVSDAGNSFAGIWIGTKSAPEPGIGSSLAPPNTTYYWALAVPDPLVTHQLQYWDGAQWVTYSQIKNLSSEAATYDNGNPPGGVPPFEFQIYWPRIFDIHSDPRTDRFGTTSSSGLPNYTLNETLRPNATAGYPTTYGPPPTYSVTAGPGWTLGGAYFGSLSDNQSSSPTSYTDPDGVLRGADGVYTDSNFNDGGYPLAIDSFNQQNSRPLMLNRAFRSVADIGYAFRDEPWKHIDFFTAESADAALLDLFCLNESPYPSEPSISSNPVPESGRLDLNTRQQPVLQAALIGAIKSDSNGTTISPVEATTWSAGLTNLTTQAPLINRSDLVTRWASTLADSSEADIIIKRRREAAIRALADVGTTRTWNLLIDVVAQSGRYTSNATDLNHFNVEGQRRYWLHIAIDRYTDKIVDQSLESINE